MLPSKSALPRQAPAMGWLGLAYDQLEQLKLDVEKFQNDHLRSPFLLSIANTYWESIVAHGQKQQVTLDQIGVRLGVNRGTTYRWMKGRPPSAEHIFGALVMAIGAEIYEIPFPANPDIVWVAVRTTLQQIASAVLGKRQELPPTPEDFACVWHFVRHPDSLLAAEGESRPCARVSEAVLIAVLRQVRREFPEVTAGVLRQALARWTLPYVLFLVGLEETQEWDSIDEIAV